jgi:polar amino acid transport system permease protein
VAGQADGQLSHSRSGLCRAFLSEIFRAGIESVERGQIEAAHSLGMKRWQALRFIILPQAIRRVLPPLGNDFIAMLKDSSLVSVLGVPDITRLGDNYATSTFLYFQTYNVVAFLYLSMTIVLTLFVRWLEKRMPQNAK